LWGKTLTAPQTLAPSTSPAAITATPEYGRTSAEAGASTAIKTSGLGGVHTEDCIVVEAFEGQKEKNTQDQKPKVRANDQGGDYRPSTLMVVINHSELSANTPEQTVSEDELAEEANISCHVSAVANRQDFQNTLTGKVVTYYPPHSMLANVLAEGRRYSATFRC
jgi:hypothetical protein